MDEQKVQEAFNRYQKRIENQGQTIDRLLNGHSYDDEIALLHNELAVAQLENEVLRSRLESPT